VRYEVLHGKARCKEGSSEARGEEACGEESRSGEARSEETRSKETCCEEVSQKSEGYDG
jgi:hypothetical protein